MGAIVHVGGPLVGALLFAAILQSFSPIKPLDMVVSALVTIIQAATPAIAITIVGGLAFLVIKQGG